MIRKPAIRPLFFSSYRLSKYQIRPVWHAARPFRMRMKLPTVLCLTPYIEEYLNDSQRGHNQLPTMSRPTCDYAPVVVSTGVWICTFLFSREDRSTRQADIVSTHGNLALGTRLPVQYS